MFALVRFVNEIDKTKRYIIPVKDIHDFYPLHLLDFDNKVTYSANWCDPNDEEDSGEYVVQILKLAETKEELKQMDKRTPVPPIHASDLEDVGKDDDARTSKKTAMQESRKKIQNQLCTKKQQLAAVLEQHTKHALVNNAAAAGKTQAAPRRKRIKTSEECSDSSDDDDSVIALSELRNSEKEAKFWKSRYKLECQHSASLKRNIDFLQKKVEKQMALFQRTLENLSQPCRCGNANQAAQQTVPEFSLCDGGLFHLSRNIFISQKQAAKLFKNKKATILVRDAAQVVWGFHTLAQRSVSGRLAPTKANSGLEPSKQLTPEKVEVIYGCLAHWGSVNNVDTTLAHHNVMRTLSEKIQDCKKKLRMN
ncbi:hypothetical protein HPB49_017327 [Dermacentor silvarum]|uniref:Uncharacterized protein n=1 Tax=Dermacentor silvarum TaxID=543639 RepID=A0ACB8CYS2_DERSI|nr:hypothetical protein HPB49_017327 [Dermacentor silvarum]